MPSGVACGNIYLNVYSTKVICGWLLDLNPAGTGATWFTGGLPAIRAFYVKNGTCVVPGEPIVVGWNTCGTATKVEVLDENGKEKGSSPAPLGVLSIKTPSKGETRLWKAKISVIGGCGGEPLKKSLDVWLHRPAKVKIVGVEVTQAIQYYRASEHLKDPNDMGPDNSLRLVANKSAYVRVYLRSGQDINWNGGEQIVNGKLTVERKIGSQWVHVTELSPVKADHSVESSYAYKDERGNIDATLNFIILAADMAGRLRLTVEVVTPSPCGEMKVQHELEIDGTLKQNLKIAALRIGYEHGNEYEAPPAFAELPEQTDFVRRAFPISGTPKLKDLGAIYLKVPLNTTPTSGKCDPSWK